VSAADPRTPEAENRELRARLAALQEEHLEETRRAHAAVAAARERAYWLDRWHVDLNAVMARPAADKVRASVRGVRGVVRRARRVVRLLSG